MPWSMSAALATPSSSMRMASSPRQTPSRLVAKPGESRTSMLSLPSRATQRRAAAPPPRGRAGPAGGRPTGRRRARGVEAGDRAEPPDAGLDLAGGGAFAAGQPVGDAGPGPRGGVAVGLDDHDRTARLQQHLGDARPHRAAADHGGPAARSLLITHGR